MIENTKTLIDVLLHLYLKDTMTVCDMTCGNGWDSYHILSKIPRGFLYAFDIQETACHNTKQKLAGFQNFRVICDTHRNVKKYCSSCDLAIYNLGYLPKGDKTITTTANEVIASLEALFSMHTKYILLTIYIGHPQGKEEQYFLEKHLKTINQKEYNILRYEFINQKNEAPYVISIERRRKE